MLKVPLFRQPRGSVICGPYCAMMLYHYYGEKLGIEDVMKGLRVYRKGVFAANIGIGFVRNGFDARLVQMKTDVFPPSYRKLPSKAILEDLKKRIRNRDKSSKELRWNAEFIEAGGKAEHRVVLLEEIRKAIGEGHPPVTVIERKVLYGRGTGSEGHYVIPVNIAKGRITINDPSSRYGGIKTYPLKDFLFAFYSWQGIALFVKPKKKPT